ncbi:hypothetical protein ACTFIU_000053 [Dictyostelium citrinum]
MPSSKFKKVKYFHRKPIIQDGRYQEPTFNGKARLLHGKTRHQESLPSCVSRSALQRSLPLRLERCSLPMEDNAIRIVDSSSNLYNAVKTSASNVERTQRISNRLLGRLINRRLYQRRMSIQLRQDDETVSQTRFQVKSRKECPRTNSINHFSRVTNRFGINAVTCSERKEEECHRDPKLLKARQCTPRKLAGLKGKLIALKDAVIPFRLYTRKTNKFHCHCLSLSNGDWDQSFVIPQDVKSEVSNWYSMIHSQVPRHHRQIVLVFSATIYTVCAFVKISQNSKI